MQPRNPVVSWAASKAAWQHVKGGDAAPLLCSLCPDLGSPPQGRCSEGWSPSPVRKGTENWDCSAWRAEGSRVT